AFAALVRLYGKEARPSITGIALIGGLASTVGWPLSAWLETRIGWRGACFAWAGIHVLGGLPLNWSLPGRGSSSVPASDNTDTMKADEPAPGAQTATA